MSKIENSIRQQISKAHSKAIKRLKNVIKNSNVIVISNSIWNKPTCIQFKRYGNDVNAWLKYCGVGEKLDKYEMENMLSDPNLYEFVTKREIMKFKKDTWPKLYSEWEEDEKKRKAEMRAKNANDSEKIKAKIAKLQKQLNSIES